MKQFLKYVLATVVGMLLVSALSLLFFSFMAVALSIGEKPKVQDNSVLQLSLAQPVMDRASADALLSRLDPAEHDISLVDLLESIEHAKGDPKIKGISLEPDEVEAGITQLGAIRRALEDFKKSGKFVLAYADSYSQAGYYLSSVADSVYTNPVGTIDLKGIATAVTYLKRFGDRYGIGFDVFRHGKFKAAVEPFLQDSMSQANREQLKRLLTSTWHNMVSAMAASRHLSPSDLERAADARYGNFTQKALQAHLIDGIRYRDQYEALLRQRLGLEAGERIALISPTTYHRTYERPARAAARIAVVFAQGEIRYSHLSDERREDVIDQATLRHTFERIRKDDHIKAVVLRVNSPGGSGLASELIWREIALTKKRKPVIVSMGDYAASGGYYIACGADAILAEPNTVTGSIGVFSLIPNAKALAHEQGIHTSVVQTNAHAYPYSLSTGISKGFRPILQASVDSFYDTFTSRVAQGRGLQKAYVDSIAQGRVWAAPDALRLKLIDGLGTLQDAVRRAAKKVGIEKYSLTYYPKYHLSLMQLLRELPQEVNTKAQAATVRHILGEAGYETYKRLNALRQTKGPIAMLPFRLKLD